MTWSDAIEQARRFSRKWRYFDGEQETKDRAFAELPARVKDALGYLCEVGEIN